MRNRTTLPILTVAMLAAAATSPIRADALIVAASAGDVCATAANPCIVSDTVRIVSGSVLDFGARTLSIGAGGLLDFDGGTATVRCGRLTAATAAAVAIKLRSGTGSAGNATIEARRTCSAAAQIVCFDDAECATQGAGACSGGSGTIDLDGKVAGNAATPSTLSLRAAGSISLSQLVDLDGTLTSSRGGTLDVFSFQGGVTIGGNVQAVAGATNSGGLVHVRAAGNVDIAGSLDLRGGDFDGGILDASAGGNVTLRNDVRVDAKAGEGFGGIVSVVAGGDITLNGGTAVIPQLVTADGHGALGFGGDGGEHGFVASGTITIGPFVRISADAALPDGGGGEIAVTGHAVSIAGTLLARGPAGVNGGDGGFVDVFTTGGAFELTATSLIDVAGGIGGAGDVTILSQGPVSLGGVITGLGSGGGRSGSLSVESDSSVTITGDISVGGAPDVFTDNVVVLGCSVAMQPGASIDNTAVSGVNRLVGRASVAIAAGASIAAAGTGGANTIVYRDVAAPPQIAGTVSPAPALVLDGTLAPCQAACTGGCDDGNACTDDVCDLVLGCSHVANSAPCNDGNACTTGDTCAAGTCAGGAPAACSDGNLCTNDNCDPVLGCTHAANNASCDDGNACTGGDACNAGACVSGAALTCNDGNPCTIDSCSPTTGCMHTNASGACDDGNACTVSDLCVAGVCTGSGAPSCDDANPCTDDVCSPTSGCTNVANSGPCDDGLACTVSDTCSQGACVGTLPVECDDGNLCTYDGCDDIGGCLHLAEPAPACVGSGKATISIKTSADDTKTRLVLRWAKNLEPIDASTLGDPRLATTYALCVYDDSAGQSPLAANLQLPPSGAWVDRNGRDWSYADKGGTVDGVQKVRLRSGAIGKGRAQLTARGAALPLPAPLETERYFNQDPAVTVQLVNDAGLCLSTQFTSAKSNDGRGYRATQR